MATVLNRSVNQEVVFVLPNDQQIICHVLEIGGDVRLRLETPADVRVFRGELCDGSVSGGQVRRQIPEMTPA